MRNEHRKTIDKQRRHVRKRFQERFGISFNRETNNAIREIIGESRFLEKRRGASSRFSVYRMVLHAIDMWVVYDRKTRQALTAYPYGERSESDD